MRRGEAAVLLCILIGFFIAFNTFDEIGKKGRCIVGFEIYLVLLVNVVVYFLHHILLLLDKFFF